MPDGMNFNYVTIVPKDGVPVTLCDAQGNPYATTGTGALVFSNQPEIHDARFVGTAIMDRIELLANNPIAPAVEIGEIGGLYGIAPGAIGGSIAGIPVWSFDAGGMNVIGNITYTGQLDGAFHSPLTTNGDLYTYISPVGPTRFPIGAAGQVLRSTGTAIEWSATGGGTVSSITGTTGQIVVTPTPITLTGTISLADTTVVPGNYGDATHIPTLTIDSKGRIVAANSVAIPAVSVETAGVAFGGPGGIITSDVANFSFDDTNNRVGIGTNAPGHSLDVQGNVNGLVTIRLWNNNTGATAQTNFAQRTGDRFVNRVVDYTTQYMEEIGSGITTRYSTFDIHRFRNNAGAIQSALATNTWTLYGSGGVNTALWQHDNTHTYFRGQNAAGNLYLGTAGANYTVITSTGHTQPTGDSVSNLGAPAARWNVAYTTTELVRGAGQTVANLNTAGALGGSIVLQDTGIAVGNGGAMVFAASQGSFGAIKGLITDGAGNTRGNISISTRRNSADASLTETVRFDYLGQTAFFGTAASVLGAITASTPAFSATQTWNNAAVAFKAFNINVTDTAHLAASYLLSLQRNGTDVFTVDKFGTLISSSGIYNGDVVQSWGRHVVKSNSPIPAGGTQGEGLLFSNVANFGMIFGSGVPTASMARGSIYMRSDGAPQYNIDGATGWSPLGGSVSVGATAPAGPVDGQLWYNSDNSVGGGQLYIRYNDGNSTAWVPSSPAATTPTTPGGDFMATLASVGLSGGVTTTLLFNVIQVGNTGSYYNPATGRWTPPAGRYQINAGFTFFSASSLVLGSIYLRKNGVLIPNNQGQTSGASNNSGSLTADALVDANGTDWFDVQATTHVASTTGPCWFSAFPISGIKGPPGDPGQLGFRLLQRTVVSVATPDVSIQNIPADINDIRIGFDLTPVTNDVNLCLQFYDGTGILNSTAGHYAWANSINYNSNASTSVISCSSNSTSGVSNSIVLSYGILPTGGVSNSATGGVSGEVSVANIRNATRAKHVTYQSDHLNGSAAYTAAVTGGGWRNQVGAITGARLVFGTGNIAAGGVMSVWGSA